MVVGHDHGHAQHLRQANLLVVGHAAVHGYQQAVSLCNFPHRVAVEAIALAVAAGNAEIHLRAHFPQGFQQDRGCAHAVHVIVAVDHDGRFLRNGLSQQAHRPLHALHQHGIMQLLKARMQKALGLFGRIHTPRTQKRRQPLGQIADGLRALRPPPDQLEHGHPPPLCFVREQPCPL